MAEELALTKNSETKILNIHRRFRHTIISFFHYLGWLFSRWAGKVFFSIEYSGQENLADLCGGGVVFIANHHSKCDPFLIGSGIPRKYFKSIKCFRYLTYYKYITRHPLGPLLMLVGAYPVYPKKGNLDKALKKTIKILNDGQSLMMFPTGNRGKYFKADDARPGIGYLAKNLNPLIVPVFVKNSYHIKLKDLIFRRRNVKVVYGKPFRYENVASKIDEYKIVAQKIMIQVGSLAG